MLKRIFAAALAFLSIAGTAQVTVAAERPRVTLTTSKGVIVLELYSDRAPATVRNFVKYVRAGHYDGTIFHRVIPGFMIQGGGMTPRMEEKPTRDPIKNESRNRLHHERGTIAMARTDEPDSATSQFFINVRNNFRLDWSPTSAGYTVFGEVVDGMFVVDSIAIEPTGPMMGHGDVPVTPILINEVVIVGQDAEEPAAEPAASE